MKPSLTKLLLSGARAAIQTALISAAFTAPALAQSAVQQLSEQTNDEIIVRGQYLYSDRVNALKSPTPILDVPQSLSITTADQIIEQGFDSIGDIVLYTPGLTQSQGEGHRDAVVFRGVRSTADFFIDGQRDDVQYYRSLYNLEQVEVLRGANALFFGRGGTGGVINRVTKKGDIGADFTGFKSSLDTFGAFDVALDINKTLNDRGAFRVNGYYESLNNHREFFDGDRFGINPTLAYKLTPKTHINLSYEYVNNERFVDRGIPSLDGQPASDLVDVTFADPELNSTTLEAHILRASIEHAFSDNIKGNFSASYGDFDKFYANLFPSSSFDPLDNTVELDGYVDTTQRARLSLSGNLVGEFDTGRFSHTLVLGGEFITSSNNNDRVNAFFSTTAADIAAGNPPGFGTDNARFTVTPGTPLTINDGAGTIDDGRSVLVSFGDFTVPNAGLANPAILNDDTEADIDVFSAYIQDEIEVTDWLDLVLGVRFDSFDITVDNIETFINTGQQDILSRRDTNIAPRLGLVIKPRENISIYGSFSETFLPRSGEQFADINPPDDVLDPNTSTNLEAGIKWDFADNFSLTAAVFDIENSSPQVSDANPDTLDVIDAEVRGFEAQIQGNITDQWHISAGYSFLEGNQVTIDTDANGVQTQIEATNAAGEVLRLRELPENTFNVWSNYQVTDSFGLGLGLTFQDESFAGNDNAVTLPSFTRIDAAAFYDVSEDLRLQINIENLTDTEYFPNAHTNNNITVGAPLNAKFTVSGRF